MARGPGVYAVGLKELRRDLKAIDNALPRELSKQLKQELGPVLADAKALTPVRTGRLRDSLRVSTRGNRAFITSRLPYANPQHWGWPSRHIHGSRFAEKAIERNKDNITDGLGDAIDSVSRRHGFK